MACKGICLRLRAMKQFGLGRYSDGQKRCQMCSIFIKWEGLICPCCGYRLRKRPRNKKCKLKLAKILSNNTKPSKNNVFHSSGNS